MRTVAFLIVMNLLSVVAAISADESKALPRVPNVVTATVSDSPVLVSGSRVNAKDFGATGNGTVDDTKALQKALDAAQTKGPICYLPPGHTA